MLITHHDAFEEAIAYLKTQPYVAVDTEFLRKRTYRPKLCLIQLASHDRVFAIDPFQIRDLQLLGELFKNKKITKVFHSCEQDLQVIYDTLGVIPKPMFDTQVAYALQSSQAHIGLAQLLQSVMQVKIPKSESASDWSKRPLDPEQIEYAFDDVRYLVACAQKLRARLEQKGRLGWAEEEFVRLASPKTIVPQIEDAYLRIKKRKHLTIDQLEDLKVMASWREELAIKCNLPRYWILQDDDMVSAVQAMPGSVNTLARRPAFNTRVIGHRQRCDLFERIEQAREQVALHGHRVVMEDGDDSHSAVVLPAKLLGLLVRSYSNTYHIALETLATSDDLSRLVAHPHAENRVLKGWRKEVIGSTLQAILAGELCVHLNEGMLNISPYTS